MAPRGRTTGSVPPPDSALLAFTDGLVERRGEDLLVGLNRLAATAALGEAPLDESLTEILP
jgi:Stage II sporulation protein E (SpoIIE)